MNKLKKHFSNIIITVSNISKFNFYNININTFNNSKTQREKTIIIKLLIII